MKKFRNEKYNLKAVIFDRTKVERFLQKKYFIFRSKKIDIIIYPIFINETELEVYQK